MLRLMRKKKHVPKSLKRNILEDNPHHHWIIKDKGLYRFFKELVNTLSPEDFLILNAKKRLCFLYSPGQYASALPSHSEYNFVILYYEMTSVIKSVDNSLAFAILLHELGHLYHSHHNSEKSAIAKQCEADAFAFKYGFGNEILEFLYSQNNTSEVKARILAMRNLIASSASH